MNTPGRAAATGAGSCPMVARRPRWRAAARDHRRVRQAALAEAPQRRGGRARGRARRSPPGASTKQRAVGRRQAEPARRQHAQHVAVREDQHVARAQAAARAPRRRARRRRRACSPPGQPSRQRSQPGRRSRICARRQPLVVAVVPFHELARCSLRSPKPASSRRLARARAAGCSRPRRTTRPRSRARERRAPWRGPASFSGMSVRPVCWPLAVQSVSAWRTITTTLGRRLTRLGERRRVGDHDQALAREQARRHGRRRRRPSAPRERLGLRGAAREQDAAARGAQHLAASARRDRAAAWARRAPPRPRASRTEQRRVAGEQRCGVPVLADAEQHDVEHRHAVASARHALAQQRLVGVRPRPRRRARPRCGARARRRRARAASRAAIR